MFDPVYIPNHIQQAIARLSAQFRTKPLIQGFVGAFILHVQYLEDAINQMFTEILNINSAVGAQLDLVGVIVGQPRNGLNDTDYRYQIFGKIAINTSKGHPEDLIEIFNIITGSTMTDFEEVYPAAVGLFANIDISGLNTTLIFQIMQNVCPAGVELFGIGQLNPTGPTFCFAGGFGGNRGGFGDANNVGVGGGFATLF